MTGKKSMIFTAMAALLVGMTAADAMIVSAETEEFENPAVQENDADCLEQNGNTGRYFSLEKDGGIWDGEKYYKDQKLVTDTFFFDGYYTYYLQADGTPMKDRLTYHPDGEHIIYFDENGHEVFMDFQYCQTVGYTCYFGSDGYIYKDEITFVNDNVYYLNADGKMEQNGWFQFANGMDYGWANSDGTLLANGFSSDPYGRRVFYHWNGMAARGLITDGTYYYSMDTADGHYLGQWPCGQNGSTGISEAVDESSSFEVRIVELVNEERLKYGLNPLVIDQGLMSAADVRAEEIHTSFSHTRPDGRGCFSILEDMNIDNYYSNGENIAYNYRSPEAVMKGWMNSPGHRANILNKNYRYIGVGAYYANGWEYVQLFGGKKY